MSQDPLALLESECRNFLVDQSIDPSVIEFMLPTRKEFGELATNVAFKLAKTMRRSPQVIADEIAGHFTPGRYKLIESVQSAGGGYVNFHVDYNRFGALILKTVIDADTRYGEPETPRGQKVVIEHTAVNPNKPWHIGHARNAILGDTVGRILRKVGYDVEIQNWINDAGLQIGETVFAFKSFNAPVDVQDKFDHYLAGFYVRINRILSEEPKLREKLLAGHAADPMKLEDVKSNLLEIERIKREVDNTLHDLEKGKYRGIIERCVDAQLQTAWHLSVFYDLLSWETDILRAELLEEAMGRIQESPNVYVVQEGRLKGCLVIKLDELIEKKDDEQGDTETGEVVLVRSNGLPTYIGKDIAYHMWKFGLLDRDMRYKVKLVQPNEEPLWTSSIDGAERETRVPDKVINVIGAEQIYAQQAVYAALEAMGYSKEYQGSHHLAYGLVQLEEGRMSGRKGVWISTDEVITAVVEEAHKQLLSRREDRLNESDARRIAEAVAIGAIRFEMVRYDPNTVITFRISDILDLKGYSSVYLQYAYVRAMTIIKKARERSAAFADEIGDSLRLEQEEERALVKMLAQYPSTLDKAAEMLSPNIVTSYGYRLATVFTQFYEKWPVLRSSGEEQRARLALVDATSKVLKNTLVVLGIPVLEQI